MSATVSKSSSGLRWADLSVRLAIALAFADASVVVLALPQIVARLHTSISHVTWVITAYNIALIASTLAILPFATRLASRRALVIGLAVFGVASVGSGASGSLALLVAWRCVQGVGGGLLLCSSLPLFAGRARTGASTLHAWATTAAFGAGVGPAAGGVLTQLFDWRAIFFTQAPFAAAAALAALGGRAGESAAAGTARDLRADLDPQTALDPQTDVDARTPLPPVIANVALGLISAGLIGALFLSTVLLINVWQLSPLGAAAILVVIPLATALLGRVVRDRPPVAAGTVGAIVLAVGLAGLGSIPDRKLGLALVALALCGTGLGIAFPALTRAALATRGIPVARAARTVAAREGGLVLGLVLLTPVLVNQLNAASGRAIPSVTRAVIAAPVPLKTKLALGAGLLAANAHAPQSQLPDLGPPFAHAGTGTSTETRSQLAKLEVQVRTLVQRAVTRSFRLPLLLCALLSLLAIPPLAYARRRTSAFREGG